MKKTAAAWAGFLALFAGVAEAQGAADGDAVDLGTLQVTGGRHEEPQFQVPQPLTVISREEIQRANPQVMTEALRYRPGAFFQQTGPGQGIVIVRGLKGAEVLHLVDGMRLNNAFFRTAPSQYIALVDPQNMAQLELLRGPYAALYGSDAMGGVVQVLTPEQRFSGPAWDARAGLRLHYGSADLARTARLESAAGREGLSVAAGFSFQDYGKRRLAAPGQSPDGMGGFTLDERVNDTDYMARGHDFKTLWHPAGGGEWMLSLQYFALPALPRYNETVPGFRAPPVPARAIALYDNDRVFHHLRYRHGRPLGFADRFEVHLAQQVMDDNRLDRQQDGSRDTVEFNRSRLTGFTAQGQTAFAAHQWFYGIEIYQDRVRSRSLREAPPGSGNVSANSAAGFQSRFPDGARASDYGLYALNEWRPAPAWLADIGARYTYRRTELPQADRAFGAALADHDFTGSLGLRYALAPRLAWTFNAGRGFRAPNINDLAQVGARSGNRVVVANLGLQPESVLSLDTGLKFSGHGVEGEAGVFYSAYRDRITLVDPAFAEGTPECADDADPATDGCAQNRNIAKARYYGFEGGLRYAPWPRLIVRGALNYSWGAQEEAGIETPANRVPPLNGQLAAELRLPEGWSLEPYLSFAGRQDRLDPADLQDSRIDPRGTPGYAAAGLRLGWVPDYRSRVQLDLRNLADRAYREHGSGIDAAGFGLGLSFEQRFE